MSNLNASSSREAGNPVPAACCCGTSENADRKRKEPPARGNAIFSFLLGVGIVFFPKCPLCWMAYMSVFGALGFEAIPYQPWMLPTMIVLLSLNVGVLWYLSRRKKEGNSLMLISLVGLVLLLAGKLYLNSDLLLYSGLFVMVLVTVWMVVPQQYRRSAEDWLKNTAVRLQTSNS